MRRVNLKDLEEYTWTSPKREFGGARKGLCEALGGKSSSTDWKERYPFDVELLRLTPGQTPYPYHSHSAQWEFYHVMSGKGSVRHKDGSTVIEAGDAFFFFQRRRIS